MLYRLWPTIVKELLSFLRDPDSRRMIFGVPLIQVLIFSFAASLEVRNIDVAVLDADGGRWSTELIERVSSAGFVSQLRVVRNMDEMSLLIERREVLLGLRMHEDFSRNIESGQGGAAQVIIDGRRANAGQVAASYLGEIAAALNTELALHNGAAMQPVAAVRHWFNPNLNYRWFIVTALGASIAMMVALMMTALSIAMERELGTFDQLLVTPSTPWEIILGKTIPAFISGATISFLVMAMAVFVFKIPFEGSFLLLTGALVVFILSVVGLGLTISSFCQTQQQAFLGLFISTIPIMVISGFMTPVENMPVWLQYLAELSPLKHFLIVVQGSFLKSMTAAEVWRNVWPMAAIAVVTLSVSGVLVRRNIQ